MPTIEIVSIGCPQKPKLPKYPTFAYKMEKKLRSHRALFQHVFDLHTGVIVHLANRDIEAGWFAGELLDWSVTQAIREHREALLHDIVRVVRSANSENAQFEALDAHLYDGITVPAADEMVLLFSPEVRTEVFDLLLRLLDASPEHRITFSTDCQSGGKARECDEVSLSEFSFRLEQRMVRMNELYFIRADGVIRR